MITLRVGLIVTVVSAGCLLLTATSVLGETKHSKPGVADVPAFHRAYYLEHAVGDYRGAAKLYEKALGAPTIDEATRRVAESRLAACREEMATSDLARVMPANAFAYVELSDPGAHVGRLLEMLGLLRNENEALDTSARLRISPELVKAALGIRGAAVALTGFNPEEEEPEGVLVFHPGRIKLIRGLIESAMPVGGDPVAPIGGFATYQVDGEVFVTLTKRLVVVSPEREQIQGVVDRLQGKGEASLADNSEASKLLTDREHALLSFFVRAEPIMPLVRQMLDEVSKQEPEAAMAVQLLDVENMHSLSGRFSIEESGVSVAIDLQLDKDHRNLVYNFLRSPAIDPSVLQSIPSGTAAFAVASLNEPNSRYAPSGPADAEGHPVVTAMDFGRELFANIAGLAVFVLPPDAQSEPNASPVPDLAAVIGVNDPTKSEAVWGQLLGVAAMAAGGRAVEGDHTSIGGTKVRQFELADHVQLLMATVDRKLILGTSQSAVRRAMDTHAGGPSIREDEQFGVHVAGLTPTSTKAIFVHPGRCAQIAQRFMSEGERSEIQPFLPLLADAVASFVLDQSTNRLSASVSITGIPDVSHLIDRQIAAERNRDKQHGKLRHAMRNKQWDEAFEQINAMVDQSPGSHSLLREKFHILAVGLADDDRARNCASHILAVAHDDATTLNNFAWSLLTDDNYKGRFDEVALKLSERSNELRRDYWAFVDTLALARFVNGDRAGAIQLQERAIHLADGRNTEDLEATLARFHASDAQ